MFSHLPLRSDSLPREVSRTSDISTDVKIPEFQYKSPEASAFKKYGDYQVNEYTGSADIRVPLYTLSYKDIDVPIDLTYDASGIKVDQEASWVGLGWNLMVGGCINYVASGKVDPKSFLASQTAWENFLATGNGDFYQFNTGFTDNSSLRTDIECGHGERDYYAVNILGKSFLFTFNPFTNAITLIGRDSEKYKVEVFNDNSSYSQLDNAVWKIIDGNGYQYYFSPGELTNAYVTGGAYTSTWNLTQIITPEGSSVNFTYCNAMQVNYRLYRNEQYDILSGYTNTSYYPTPGYSTQMIGTNVSVQTKYLTSVETRDQRISFILEERSDIDNAKRLKKISVYSKIAQQTIKEFTFNHDYFTASTVGGNYLNDQPTTTSYPQELGLRLKLNSVTETAGATSLTTSFTYNEQVQLPLKTSCAKDFWGYYNHKENSGTNPILSAHTLLPTPLPLFIGGGIQLTNIYRTLKGANRYCDGIKMQAAMLTKITYPTKGYTTFTYEPNKFVNTTRYPTTAEYAANVINVSLMDSNNPNQTTHQQLNLTENTYGMITVNFSGTLSSLKNAGASVTITPMNPNMGSAITYDLSLASDNDIAYGSYFTMTQPIDLQGTSYMMTVNCPNSLGSSGYYVSTSLNATQAFTASNVPVSTGGGLRIKSIRNYHHDGTLQYYTSYDYTDGAGNCTGKLLQPLSFSEGWNIICAYQGNCPDPGCILTYYYNLHRLIIPSTDVPVFFSSLAGGTVGYSTVWKRTYSGNNSLISTVKTDYTNNLPQYVNDIHYFDNDNNGTIRAQTITDSISGTIKRKGFTYSNVTATNRCNAIVYDRVRDYTDWGYISDGPNGGRFNVKIYPFYISWNRLDSMTDSTCYNELNQAIVKNYTYNDINHQVKKVTENSSNPNITYEIEYKYPSDFSTQSPCSLMCNTTYHMLYPIIEQSLSAIEGGTTKLIKKRKNTYTSYTNKYRDATYNTRVFLLTGSSFALNGGSLESRLSYVYNNKCDRISITKDTEKVTYLWAYNYMYPVAEIRGATYDELVSWGLSTNISNLATMTTTANVSSALATIRSSLASRPVLMTSYTYDPLIGITSTTAPNGTKTSYTYDVMGRLSNVKNHGGNIIRQHSYNYKTN